MRGRTSSNNARARLRSAGYKCSLCGRRMIDAEALKRHNKTVHNISSVRPSNKQVTLKTNRPVNTKQQVLTAKERKEKNDIDFDALLKDDIAKSKVIKKKKFESRTDDNQSEVAQEVTGEARDNFKKYEEKRAKTIADFIQYESSNDSEFKNGDKINEELQVTEKKFSNRQSRSVEFECPVCFRKFSAYFTTHKHIQKAHCVNSAGAIVASCSPELVKPVRVEKCMKCGGSIRSVEPHLCSELEMTDDELSKASFFLCSACHQGFISMRVFDLHVAGLHSEGVHSLFFPTKIEYTNWRLEMERETQTKYFILGEYDHKKIYRCNYAKENKLSDKTTAHLCPSSMVIQEFSKGIQVHYYKDHYDHTANDYNLFGKYRKYSITSFLKRAENYNVTDLTTHDNDLYMQFKILMENIVLDAAKINIQNLNVLVEKALEMTSVLTCYEEEIDESKPHPKPQKMSDKEISEALQDTRKRKMSLDSVKEFSEVTTRSRRKSLYASPSRGTSPVILNSFSLATKDPPIVSIQDDNIVRTADKKPEDIQTITTPAKVEVAAKISNNVRVTRFSQSTSFNDTYKDFVDKTIQATIAADKSFKDKAKKRSPRSTPALKTKIGQFKPSISPKTPATDSNSPEPVSKIKVSDKSVKKFIISHKDSKVDTKEEPTAPKVPNTPKAVPNTPKAVPHTPKAVPNAPKAVPNTPKAVPNTPKAAPKVTKSKVQTPKHNAKVKVKSVKRKPDFVYEIREQENDCNILVLKI